MALLHRRTAGSGGTDTRSSVSETAILGGMTGELICIIVAVALFAKFILAPRLRWATPEQYTIRYLLLLTTVIAVVLGVARVWIPQ